MRVGAVLARGALAGCGLLVGVLGLALRAEPLAAQNPTLAPRRVSLDEAVRLATGVSEDVGIARAGVDRADGQRRQARAGFFPQLSGSATYTRTIKSQFDIARDAEAVIPAACQVPFSANPALPFGNRLDSLESAVQCVSRFGAAGGGGLANLPFGRPNTYDFSVALSQKLFDGGRTSGQARAAGAQLRSAELGLTAAQAQIALDVTQAYYDASLADRLVVIAEKTLEQADSTFKQTQLARQVGTQSEFDLLRARVTRDNQRPVVIARRADRDVAYLRLRQLLDFPSDLSLELTSELGDTTALPLGQVAELVRAPGDTSPEARAPVRQAREQLAAQRSLLQAAKAGHWPSVSATSTFAQFAYPSGAFPGSDDFLTDWTVGIGVSVPLFTGGRLGGDTRVAKANLREAELRVSQTRKLARLDGRSTQTQVEAAAAAWEASSGTVEQAQRAYEIADLRYREGLSTQTELLDARVALEQAQGNRARAARDLQVAKMRLLLLPALPLASAAAIGSTVGQSTTTTTTQNPATPSSVTPLAGVTTGTASASAGVSP
jgi:outer membrane protein TolC